MLSKKKKSEILEIEINHLVEYNWDFLNNDWPVIETKQYHRTDFKEVIDIDEIKSSIVEKLGYIGPFYFLTEIFGNKDRKGPYRNIEKGLLLIFQLLEGKTMKEMGDHIPSSTYFEIYKEFWFKEYKLINDKIDQCLANMFSNEDIRILSASLNNPTSFKHVTLLYDGHDSRISYRKPNISKKKLYSYKLKKAGFRTQILIDINQMCLYVSTSEPCKNNTDGNMLIKSNLTDIMSIYDCLGLDGGYTMLLNDFLEKEDNNIYSLNNFCFPIRKDKNKELKNKEKNLIMNSVHFDRLLNHILVN